MTNKFINWILNNKDLIDTLLQDDQIVEYIAKYCIVQSFTTKLLCNKVDICKKDNYQSESIRIPTNKELDNFFQSIYHAGTLGQFFNYAKIPNHLNTYINTTFHYLFDVFKKGIYIYIKDNNIKVFLPFSNSNYTNDWGKNLKTTKGDYRSVVEIEENNHWNPKYIPYEYHTMIQKDPNKWYANYNIFRNTIYKNGKLRFKEDEGDKSIANFLQLITELCYTRIVPDVCFFISPRDFPILRKDMKHPYDRLYLPNNPPYLGDKYKLSDSIPIFSQSITDEYNDKLIPNDDDIVSILCGNNNIDFNTNWDSKKNIAVFRGSATGCGTLPYNNPRLHLYELAKYNQSIMDVKLIGLNEKIKVDENGYVKIIDKFKYPKMDKHYKEINSLTPKEQSNFKFIIHIQGHVAAFRLTRELAYGSVILKVNSKWKTWYSDKLIGWKAGDNSLEGRKLRDSAHFLIIEENLSNLVSTINWCMESKRNDDICKNIANRALDFYKQHFSNKDFMLNYMHNHLKYYSEIQYNIKSNPKGLIIIPFRDDTEHKRQLQLNQLSKYFDSFLDKNKIDYVLSIQQDNQKFNRGLLLNKMVIQKPNYDYYIFHDVDLIPNQDLLKHYYEYPLSPIHLGHRGQRWSENIIKQKKFIGGVFSINKYDFYFVNGFPNDFWGWGGEDDALSERLRINNININIPSDGFVTDLENLTIEEKLIELNTTGQKNMSKIEQLNLDKKNWPNNGIKQLIS